MSRKQFEEELRARLNEYAPQVDADQIWNNIKQEQPKNYLAYMAGVGVLLFSALVGFVAMQQTSQPFAESASINTTELFTTSNHFVLIDNQATNTFQIETNRNFDNNVSSIDSDAANQIGAVVATTVNQINSIANSASTILVTQVDNENEKQFTALANAENQKGAKRKTKQQVKYVKRGNKEASASYIRSSLGEDKLVVSTPRPVPSVAFSEPTLVTEAKAETVSAQEKAEAILLKQKVAKFERYIASQRKSFQLEAKALPPAEEKHKLHKSNHFKSNRKSIGLTLEVMGGPMFPIKSLSVKNSEQANYLNQRNLSEKVLRGYHLDVNVISSFKKYLYLKGGISYMGFREAFMFDENLSTNKYNMLDFAAAVGVKYGKSRWHIFADAGLSMNTLFKTKGTYLNEELEMARFNEADIFNTNLGPAVLANVGFIYEINKDFNFKIQTGYKRYFKSFSTALNPIEQRYNFVNLGMGIQYNFSNYK